MQLKSETDGVNFENNKYEPQPEHAQDKNMHHNGTIAEFTDGEMQGLAAQKFDNKEGLKKSDSKIQYIHYEGKPIKPDKTESLPLRQTSVASQRIHYSLVTLSNPRSFEAEQFKILRANLLFPKSGKPPKTILLTSCVPGEGKTFTAINLAVSLAQNLNSHVLLVDADIRKPDVHTRFGFSENIAGLSDFLTHNRPISSLLLQTQLPNLSLLPGGKAVINPSELLSSEKMKELLTELSTRYSDRYVIIDAPPPKLASETCALARFVERIIPVVRSGSSNRTLVEEMINLLERDKIKGIVLNYYDIRGKKRYGYRKYHEYYSR
jgi:exopolysaccharide/PEP-CTERM locus tyrosine autokinase